MHGTISFAADLTIESLSSEIKKLRDVLSEYHSVEIDVSEVGRIDFAAVQMLAAAKKECLLNSREFILKDPRNIISPYRSMGIDL